VKSCEKCVTHGRNKKFIQNFTSENLDERQNLEDLGVVSEVTLKWILDGCIMKM
jgi:hypothetical protein